MLPDCRFRIASISKPLTAVAVLQLVERKQLDLDELVFPLLKLKPAFDKDDAKLDERWKEITVRQCLQHTAGWDRAVSFDPIGRAKRIAKVLGTQTPVDPEQIIRYMLGQPLDFDPGERYAYSNLGYLVLGRLIERISGQKYEDYVQQHVLAPLSIERMQLGRALRKDQLSDEVCYYDSQERTGKCLYPPLRDKSVPICYGAENFEGFEAHGGWIASAGDLVKFASAFDNFDRSPLLKRKTIETMWARPEGAAGKNKQGEPADHFYGCGWMVRPVGDRGECNAWHTGYIAGSEALLVRRWDGLVWAVLFNTAGDRGNESLAGRIDPLLHKAAAEVKEWPA
jgi:N-acyl-D-amino-acid deacylase